MSQVNKLKEIIEKGEIPSVSPDSPNLIKHFFRKDLTDDERIALFVTHCHYTCGLNAPEISHLISSLKLKNREDIKAQAQYFIDNVKEEIVSTY